MTTEPATMVVIVRTVCLTAVSLIEFIFVPLFQLPDSPGSADASHCSRLLPNLSSIGTRGQACDAHRPDILVSVILGIGLLGLDLPSIRFMWRRGRESNPPESDRQSDALPRGLPRLMEKHTSDAVLNRNHPSPPKPLKCVYLCCRGGRVYKLASCPLVPTLFASLRGFLHSRTALLSNLSLLYAQIVSVSTGLLMSDQSVGSSMSL